MNRRQLILGGLAALTTASLGGTIQAEESTAGTYPWETPFGTMTVAPVRLRRPHWQMYAVYLNGELIGETSIHDSYLAYRFIHHDEWLIESYGTMVDLIRNGARVDNNYLTLVFSDHVEQNYDGVTFYGMSKHVRVIENGHLILVGYMNEVR